MGWCSAFRHWPQADYNYAAQSQQAPEFLEANDLETGPSNNLVNVYELYTKKFYRQRKHELSLQIRKATLPRWHVRDQPHILGPRRPRAGVERHPWANEIMLNLSMDERYLCMHEPITSLSML